MCGPAIYISTCIEHSWRVNEFVSLSHTDLRGKNYRNELTGGEQQENERVLPNLSNDKLPLEHEESCASISLISKVCEAVRHGASETGRGV